MIRYKLLKTFNQVTTIRLFTLKYSEFVKLSNLFQAIPPSQDKIQIILMCQRQIFGVEKLILTNLKRNAKMFSVQFAALADLQHNTRHYSPMGTLHGLDHLRVRVCPFVGKLENVESKSFLNFSDCFLMPASFRL